VVKVGESAPVEGVEAAPLGRREVVGQREGGEVVEGAADVLEPALELDGAGRDGGRRSGAQPTERIAQELAAVGLVGDAEGLDEQQALSSRQPVPLGAVEELVLFLGLQLAQGTRERRADAASGEPLLHGRRQARAHRQAGFDPAGLVPQQPRNAARGEPVLLDERADHLRLVERGHGARGSVGQEQQALVLGRRGRALDDHRHPGRTLFTPALQALEAVEDLEAPVIGGRDAQRQLG